MKILALVEDLRINKTSAGIRRNMILKSLILEGHNIDCLYDYYDNVTFPWFDKDNINLERIKELKESKFISALRKIPKSNALPAYTTGFSFEELRKIKSWKLSIQKKLNESYDFILVLGAGNSNLNFFAISKLTIHIPYIVNYHDPYPIHQYPKPYAKPSSHVGRLKAKQSNKVMQNAFKVSFPSQRLFEWMSNFHPVLKKKSFILPHVYTPLKNLPTLETDSLLNLETTNFNILHGGSLLGPRNPKHLLKAFASFIEIDEERKKHACLNIVGSVAKDIENFEKNKELTNVNIIKTRVSYLKSLELLKQADVLLVLEAISKNNPFMPGKLADYFAVEKPVLALTPKTSETARILGSEYKLITEMDNEEEILNILNLLWTNWKENSLDTFISNETKKYVSSENFNYIMNNQLKEM